MPLLPEPNKCTECSRLIVASSDEGIAASSSNLETTWQLAATEPGNFYYVAPDTCSDVILGRITSLHRHRTYALVCG